MKYLFALVLLLPLMYTAVAADDVIDKTAELFRQGNVRELAKGFSSSVDITVLGEENIYSADEAVPVLDDFFKKNHPHSVRMLHRITSNPNYRYGVFILETDNGAYRVAVNLRKAKEQFEITEIRIETEKTK